MSPVVSPNVRSQSVRGHSSSTRKHDLTPSDHLPHHWSLVRPSHHAGGGPMVVAGVMGHQSLGQLLGELRRRKLLLRQP
jgi:hypothetical protein